MAYSNRFGRNRPNAPREGGVGEQMAVEAVTLAGQGQWTLAAKVNRELLKTYPKDTKTLNRLGKCLTELGSYEEATVIYQRTLDSDRDNDIARKNLGRLTLLAEQAPGSAPEPGAVTPQTFITDPGKSAVAVLRAPADPKALASAAPGTELVLSAERGGLIVRDRQGRSLGVLEPQLAKRLIALQKGGNAYAVALASVADDTVRVVLRETYRHPTQINTASFVGTGRGDPLAAGELTRDMLLGSADEEGEDEENDESPSSLLAGTEGDYPESDPSETEERDPFASETPRLIDSA